MNSLNALMLIAATLVTSSVFDWIWKFWQRSDDARRRQEAGEILRAHGMEAHAYLASFAAENGQLREALSAFDFTNQIVLDREGRLVGRVLPKTQQSGPGLRLVVDNTK